MKTTIYIANKDSWFDEGSICVLLEDHRQATFNCGLFCGIRTCKNPPSENKQFGERYLDEEECGFYEFDRKEIEIADENS